MKKTKIDWCDSTWNPVTGCLHGCEYCYARGIAKRFSYEGATLDAPAELQKTWITDSKCSGTGNRVLRYPVDTIEGKHVPYPFGFQPTFHRYKLDEYANKKAKNIFVCSMADLFGEWVPDKWIEEIFTACEKAPQHNYMFLTKNPDRYIELLLKNALPENKNMWYGMSVTRREDTLTAEAITQDLPSGSGAFLSIEPILEDVVTESLEIVAANFTDWIIVGAETGRRKDKVVPKREWIEQILEECRKYGIPLFMKSSLAEIWGEPLIQEYPKKLEKNKAGD